MVVPGAELGATEVLAGVLSFGPAPAIATFWFGVVVVAELSLLQPLPQPRSAIWPLLVLCHNGSSGCDFMSSNERLSWTKDAPSGGMIKAGASCSWIAVQAVHASSYTAAVYVGRCNSLRQLGVRDILHVTDYL